MKVRPPIVVNLGKARDAHIRALRRGTGPLIEDIEEVMRLVRESAAPQNPNTIFLPIVAVYHGGRGSASDTADEVKSTHSAAADADEC